MRNNDLYEKMYGCVFFRSEENLDVGILVGYNGTGGGHLVYSSRDN